METMLRLPEFIRHNMESILVEWEAFAATLLPAASGMTSTALRNHAEKILKAIAQDIGAPQSRHEQSEKSKGRAPKAVHAPETAAQTHGLLRAHGGFDINQLVAEYRALRASVLRLWIDGSPLNNTGIEDMIRFNEAIDQAIAESVDYYYTKAEQDRNLLLGIIGHDMRSPLSTILMTASHLAALNSGEQVSAAAVLLIRSGEAIQSLLNDLVDFNRIKLGVGIKVVPSDIDLAVPMADEVEQLRGAHPNRCIELTVTGNCRGQWDALRLKQLLRNLVSNAVKYGAPDTPVRVTLRGEEAMIRLDVTNSGPPIDPSAWKNIFDPLKRGVAREGEDDHSLGLGLFIVNEIARAHGGEVELRSERGETTAAVRMPRQTRSARLNRTRGGQTRDSEPSVTAEGPST